jgi:hypothetical protein
VEFAFYPGGKMKKRILYGVANYEEFVIPEIIQEQGCTVDQLATSPRHYHNLKGEVEPSPLEGLICGDLNYVFEAVITVILCINNK